MNLDVVDKESLAWTQITGRESYSIVVGDIMGINGHSKLVDPEDPAVTAIGVIVLVGIRDRQYPIFTDGDTYRRLAIPDISSIRSIDAHSVSVFNVFSEDTKDIHLSKEDGVEIKRAVTSVFDGLG